MALVRLLLDFVLLEINCWGGDYWFASDGEGSSSYAYFFGRIAPVVTFDSVIQVKSGSGTTEDPYVIGK